ncbi:hypothetical protein A2U01_0025046 [Trifolium medium]|uniref:Uncharacterized protein n=1 Tax=Trifolium medium TaxID=97028 RepID=A0A392NX25_9FABA|nr:hypothetical protein [Trifolium medium]
MQDIATIVEGVLSNDATAEYDGMVHMEMLTLYLPGNSILFLTSCILCSTNTTT